MNPPTVIIIGEPNGAGKSTIAPGLFAHLGLATFVNADTIARPPLRGPQFTRLGGRPSAFETPQIAAVDCEGVS